MGDEPESTDYEIVKYLVDQGYGRSFLDILYIVEETNIPYIEVIGYLKQMDVLSD